MPEGWNRPGWDPNSPAPANNLMTDIRRQRLQFRPMPDSRSREGYGSATIDLAHRFMVCAGEIHFAYSLDRQSVSHSADYFIRSADVTQNAEVVRPDSEPPAPLTFPMNAEIVDFRGNRFRQRVQDAIAGEALGMGCFSGQSKKLGTVAQILGANATPAQAQEFINGLRILTIDDIPFTLTHPQPVDPAARARREAEERQARANAEAAERAARERAEEAERVRQAGFEAQRQAERQRMRPQAEALYDQLMAGGPRPAELPGPLWAALNEVIAERTAAADAEYRAQLAAQQAALRQNEAETAAWRAEVERNERAQAQWRAEMCRIEGTYCDGR